MKFNSFSFLKTSLVFFSSLSMLHAQEIDEAKMKIKFGVEITPGLCFGWSSKDYEIAQEGRTQGGSIITPFLTTGVGSAFYFKRIFLTANLLFTSEEFVATVPLLNGSHGLHYDLDYKTKYIDIPIGIYYILNDNYNEKKTYLGLQTELSFIFNEKIRKFNSSIFYDSLGNPFYYNDEINTNKLNYNRTLFILTIGRETPLKENSFFYFKRAISYFTSPIYIKRNTKEIITNSKLGATLGIVYKIR